MFIQPHVSYCADHFRYSLISCRGMFSFVKWGGPIDCKGICHWGTQFSCVCLTFIINNCQSFFKTVCHSTSLLFYSPPALLWLPLALFLVWTGVFPISFTAQPARIVPYLTMSLSFNTLKDNCLFVCAHIFVLTDLRYWGFLSGSSGFFR